MRQEDLIILPEEVKQQQQVTQSRTRVSNTNTNVNQNINNNIPYDYIPVKLDSLGKLEAPAILHFRNYNMEDMLELTSKVGHNSKQAFAAALNKMVYENFNCEKLHENELTQILVTLYKSFWSNVITIPYHISQDISQDILDSKKNIENIDIDINKISTKPIANEFKEPFRLKNNVGKEVCFRLPKLKNALEVDRYLQDKYAEQQRYFSDFENKLKEYNQVQEFNDGVDDLNKQREEKNKQLEEAYRLPMESKKPLLELDNKLILEYQKYVEKKAQDFVKLNYVSFICDPGLELNLLEKISYVEKNKINMLEYIGQYNTVMNKYSNFGIQSELEIPVKALGNKVEKRRLLFQLTDFIPSMELSSDKPIDVIFG
jgi:hypothetical protein